MEKRRLELIEAECRRHAALARADAARRAEHEEVAEALAWALRHLGKEEPICVSVRLTPLSRRLRRGNWGQGHKNHSPAGDRAY